MKLLEDKYNLDTKEYEYKVMKQGANDNNQTYATPPSQIPLYFPSLSLCTDNGAMVAWAAIEKLKLGLTDEVEGQEVIPKWPLGRPLDDEALFKKPVS